MKRIAVGLLAVVGAVAVRLSVFGAPLPEPVGGVVTLASGTTYTLTADDSLSGIANIAVTQGATLEYDIAEGRTLTIPFPVRGKGNVIKNGKGTVKYTSVNTAKTTDDYYIEYPGTTFINDGQLVLPDYSTSTGVSYQWSNVNFGRMVVNKPGVLVAAVYTRMYIRGLWGDGEVTSLASGSYNQLALANDLGKANETYHAPSQFSGLVSGALRMVPYGYADLLNPDNTNTGDVTLLTDCNVGIVKFGNEGQTGSLGKQSIQVREVNTCIRYLGEGETTTRTISFGSAGVNLKIDAGKTGNLVLKGAISATGANQDALKLELSGDSANECRVDGSIKDGGTHVLSVAKSGTGTWVVNNGANGTYRGLVTVENGTLAFNSLAEKGMACALGTAANVTGAAVKLGTSSTVGTLEFRGDKDATCVRRSIALTGKGGRLVGSSAASMDWSGVSATKASTLRLAGDGKPLNTMRDVTGPVSVVKEGAGAWRLDGVNTFSGDLSVKGGELTAVGDLSKKDFNFTWFKFIIRGTSVVSGSSDENAELEELAFYDAAGNRLMDGFELVKTYEDGQNVNSKFADLTNIQPGQYGWLSNGAATYYQAYGNRDANRLFDNKKTSPQCCCIHYPTKKPIPDNPSTWMPLLIRLPANAPTIASFDVMAKDAPTAIRAVTDWTMLGSEDGVNWYTIKTFDYPGDSAMPGSFCWFSDRKAATFSTTPEVRVGYPLTIEGGVASLKNVGKITVSGGATLNLVGALEGKTLELAGGSFVTDTRSQYSFETLDLTADSAITVAEGAKLTVGDATARAWNPTARLDVTTVNGGEVEFLGLTPLQKSQVYLNGESLAELDSERVVFLGDSIVHSGYWQYILQSFVALRNPGVVVRLLNCGISGDNTGGALARLDSDVFALRPTRVVVMLGMNDVGRNNYAENPTDAQIAARATSIANYAKNMTNLVDRILANGAQVTLVTPTPFDEYGSYDGAVNYPHCNEEGLAALARIVRDLAADRGVDLIDLHDPMTRIYRKGVEFNRSDRVHPELVGHVLMSLLTWDQWGYGAAPYSSRAFAATSGKFDVTYSPQSLPFPKTEEFAAVKAQMPEEYAAMNREIVKVTGLPTGNYSLMAGDVALGRFTSAELEAGVNLAELDTPSQAAAQTAFATMKTLRDRDVPLRNIVMMEIQAKRCDPSVNLADYDAVCTVLENWYKTITNNQSYYRSMINSYEANKPKQAQIEADVKALRERLNAEAKPLPYTLTIAQTGVLEIPANQGDVTRTVAELEAAEGISIGAGSRLVIRDVGSEKTALALKANIFGAGDLLIKNASVSISGDNHVWTGKKVFSNSFVVVSSRYGLGSPDVALENYIRETTDGYLRFQGNGLTNDVPLHLMGRGYSFTGSKTALTFSNHEPLVLNGAVSISEAAGFRLGDYEFAGGFYGSCPAWLNSYSDCETWITGPFKIGSGIQYLVFEGVTCHIKPNPASTAWQRDLYPRNGARIICEGPNVWGTKGSLALGAHQTGGGNPNSAGTFDMNGYDQTFETVGFYDSYSVQPDWVDLRLYVTSSVPATLTMTGAPMALKGVPSRQGIRFVGAAGFAFVGAGAWTNVLFRSETTGTLTVGKGDGKSEVFFDWGASWGGDVVLNGGRFGCDTAKGLGRKAKVAITNGGQLIVPKGMTLSVSEVSVNGQKVLDGTYSGESWILGGGSVRSGKVGAVVLVR